MNALLDLTSAIGVHVDRFVRVAIAVGPTAVVAWCSRRLLRCSALRRRGVELHAIEDEPLTRERLRS